MEWKKGTNKWGLLVKEFYEEVTRTTSLRGASAFKEAIQRAKKVYIKKSKASILATARRAMRLTKIREKEARHKKKEEAQNNNLTINPETKPVSHLPSFQDLT